jgi:hypothetical protein
MRFSGLVDRLQPGQELRGDLLRLGRVERSPILQHLQQRGAVHVLHGHQLLAVDLDQIEHPADVGRHHLARRPDLRPERLSPGLVDHQLWPYPLERHLHPQLEVEGVPHLAHPTRTEQRLDPIAVAEHAARLERQAPLDFAIDGLGGLRHAVAAARIVVRHFLSCFLRRV